MTALSSVIMRDTHANRPAAGTAGRLYYETDTTTLFRDSGSVWESVEGSGSSGGATILQLDYAASTNLANGLAVSATTWTDIGTNQSFTVSSASSLVEVSVRGSVLVGEAASSADISSRIVLDSAGTPTTRVIGGSILSGAVYENALQGSSSVFLSGLSAATHTVKVQVYAELASAAYCRAATKPNVETLGIQVIEHT